jgi:hypothetical protein
MARYGDTGPYAAGNVVIIANEQNVIDGHKGKPHPPMSPDHKAKIAEAMRGNKSRLGKTSSVATKVKLAKAAHAASRDENGRFLAACPKKVSAPPCRGAV